LFKVRGDVDQRPLAAALDGEIEGRVLLPTLTPTAALAAGAVHLDERSAKQILVGKTFDGA
jgi:hypothetical protein